MVYQVALAANTCRCKVIVNGLGVTELNAEKVGCIQYPLNTELVGIGNVVEIEVTPISLDPTVMDKISAEGTIKKYDDGAITGPESGEVLASFTLEDKIAEVKAKPLTNIADVIPFTLTCTFDSEEAPSFRNRLVDADVIDNGVALVDWAMNFKEMLRQQDVAALYDQYEPKLLDYDIAYPEDKEPDNRKWFANWMYGKIFPQTPLIDFDRDGVQLVKWCGGRIWELRRKDEYNGGYLWQTVGTDDRWSYVEVYVGMVDGKIKMVR